MSLDVLIRGGRVVDGLGSRAEKADVAIRDGRVVEVGHLDGAAAAQVIDATGLVVAPGFIDIHSHGDTTIVADPRARSAVAQGVTTVVVGNCGHAPAPLPDPDALPELSFGSIDPAAVRWDGFRGYLDAVDEARPAVNVAALAGHNALRVAALGRQPREASPDEVEAMATELDRAMDAGAFGLSVGLEYPLGRAATTAEVTRLAAATEAHDALFAIHTRDRDVRAEEAFDEAFGIARDTGVRLQVSHIAPRRGAPKRSLERVLERIDRSPAAGLDVACDQHTRLHGITKLVTMFPPSASARGTDELLGQLRDPAMRRAFHDFREPIHKLGLMGEWDKLALFEAPASPELVGKDFATIADELHVHPLEAMMDILLAAGEGAQDVLFVGLVQTQQDLDQAFASSTCAPESDATILGLDGPTAGQRFLGAYTWAALYLGSIVRQRRVLTLEEGIRRLTSVPARRVGLEGRGSLVRGSWADVVVFDPKTVAESGTLEAPNAYPTGIRHVLVNGIPTVVHGSFTPDRPGHVLRRDAARARTLTRRPR